MIKIHDTSAPDAADLPPGSDHVGGRDAGGGRFGVEVVLRRTWRAGKRFSSTEKLGRVFLPSLVDIACGGRSRKRRFSRCVSCATHVKSCACWERFFLDRKTWPGFLFPGLVGIALGGGVQENGASPVALVLWRT